MADSTKSPVKQASNPSLARNPPVICNFASASSPEQNRNPALGPILSSTRWSDTNDALDLNPDSLSLPLPLPPPLCSRNLATGLKPSISRVDSISSSHKQPTALSEHQVNGSSSPPLGRPIPSSSSTTRSTPLLVPMTRADPQLDIPLPAQLEFRPLLSISLPQESSDSIPSSLFPSQQNPTASLPAPISPQIPTVVPPLASQLPPPRDRSPSQRDSSRDQTSDHAPFASRASISVPLRSTPFLNLSQFDRGTSLIDWRIGLHRLPLQPAMRSLFSALTAAGFPSIRVSTPHFLSILSASQPLSAGRFRSVYDLAIFSLMFDFHSRTKTPFLFNPYPCFGYTDETLNYALFKPNDGVYNPTTQITYTNMFDAQIDLSVNCQDMERAAILFDLMQIKDMVSYCSLMPEYYVHCAGAKAAKLFDEMLKEGNNPSDVAFTVILTSCRQASLLSEMLVPFYEFKAEPLDWEKHLHVLILKLAFKIFDPGGLICASLSMMRLDGVELF